MVAKEIVDVPCGTHRVLGNQPATEVHPFEFRMKFTAREPMQSLDGCQMGGVSSDLGAFARCKRRGIRRRREVPGEW